MGVDLFTALLAGGHGLTSGILANRQKKEQDAREQQALIYKQAQDAIAAAGEADMRRLKEKEIDNYKAPMAQAKLDTATTYGNLPKWNELNREDKQKFEAEQRDLDRKSREKIADGYQTISGAKADIEAGKVTPVLARTLAGTLTYQIASLNTQRNDALATINKVMMPDSLKAQAAGRLQEIDTLIEATRAQLNEANKLAGQFMRPTGPAMNTSAPIPGIMGSGAPGDTADVPGATDDAIKTPAGTVRPDTAAVTRTNPATGPTAAETRGPMSFMMPTLTDALAARGGAKVPTAPTHKPGKVPPEIKAKIEAVVRASGITPGTNQWNEQVARRMILWQRQQAAKGL